MSQIRNVTRADRAMASSGATGLRYPSDISERERTNHYVQFFINQQSSANVNYPSGYYSSEPSGTTSDNSTVTVDRAPTRRLSGHITLYMPNQLQVSHKANYGEAEMGFAIAAGMAAVKGMQDMDMNNFASKLASGASTVGQAAANGLVSLAEQAGLSGAEAAYSISRGKTVNNRTEMKFEGIDRRSFNFTFRLMPSSSAEAENIRNIVTLFRLHSMPEVDGTDSTGRTLIAPSTFDIEYTPGQQLHRISTCVLEAVDVKFGGERTQFFEDDHPVETELTLSFKELEIITRERVAQGY